ncbi:MAG: glycosyltransferase family 4 protein [Capsulimonadales bacterium]|nr:glycosyltransferase family 4 protein [Capsulimonadales bacterium]
MSTINHPSNVDSRRTVLFLSSCTGAWGGSEELWSQTALRLVGQGHRVHAVKMGVDRKHRRIRQLTDAGISLEDHWNVPMPPGGNVARRLLPRRWTGRFDYHAFHHLCDTIRQLKPDIVVISQGDNFDGLEFVTACQKTDSPYLLVSHKASDLNWPVDWYREAILNAYTGARASYFVSRHNRELTEAQIGVRLSNAEVVRNPFLTPVEEPLPWPESPDGRFRLACVGRIFIRDKGQDLLVRVLAQEKWRSRPLEVAFFGEGVHGDALKQMAGLLGVDNVRFPGFAWNVEKIWQTHHALALPSRAEGLPLTVVEAMWCGRPIIVTDVGGNAELMDDGETGFLATGPSVEEFDTALERAWERREEWERIGQLAARRIRERIPADPIGVFVDKIFEFCGR